ncbi:hypothetical protein GCM10028801_19670 [Nocardioides maradonensis]
MAPRKPRPLRSGPRPRSAWSELRSARPAAARQLRVIFVISGLLALAGAAAPDARSKPVFVGIGVCDLLIAALAGVTLRTRGAGLWVLLLGAGSGLPIIAVAGRYGALPSSAVFVVLLFVWIGANFPPGTSWWLLPAAAAAYLYAVGPEHLGLQDLLPPLLVMLAGCVVVAETIARAMARLRIAEAQTRARATELQTLVEAAVALNSLDVDVVLQTAVTTLIRLGHDAAAIALIDSTTGALRLTHTDGLIPRGAAAAVASGDRGVTGRALREDATVVETDYTTAPDAIPAVADAGFRTMIATPVHADDATLGVLLCASTGTGSATDDPEVVELLAAHVGRALTNASDYARQEIDAAYHATQASVDPLTGVGNRRQAHALLAGLQPGDAVLLFDLDDFKSVNDTLGHAVGDHVLQDFARFLRSHTRPADGVVRMGGEEFMVIWRATDSDVHAPEPHFVDAWRATEPLATVSAGLCVHREGRSPEQTLAAADTALYAAKRDGRDRIVTYAA